MMNDMERAMKWDAEQARDRALCSYKNLQREDPTNGLLKFARVIVKGRIFKKEEIEIVPEHREEYYGRYSPGKNIYPLPYNSYASDLEKALKND